MAVARSMLDTSVLIDFSKGREPVHSRVLAMFEGDDEMGVCAVQVAEFCAGLRPEQRPRCDAFFAELRYWDIAVATARRAGIYRFAFGRTGRTLTTAEALIAAVALQAGATVVTTNVKDFRIPDVHVLAL